LQDQYAHRDAITDVVVRKLQSSQDSRLQCKVCVKQLAVYDRLVAVLCSDSIAIYEKGKEVDQPFQLLGSLPQLEVCERFVVASKHVTVCSNQRLQCFDFQGKKYAPARMPLQSHMRFASLTRSCS
jgi:hypothetical protein